MKQPLTSLVTLWIFSFLTGCAAFAPKTAEVSFPVMQVFKGTYEEVWRAVQKSLAGYPLAVVNIDQGLIETETIRSDQALTPPHRAQLRPPAYKYNLRATVLRGTTAQQTSVRVTIDKAVRVTSDFFTGDRARESDGWEERLILYRIDRELQLDKFMRRAFEKGAKL